MSKRQIISISLNEEEMKMFNKLKEHIFETYYKDDYRYKDLSDYPNSSLFKQLLGYEYYTYYMNREEN